MFIYTLIKIKELSIWVHLDQFHMTLTEFDMRPGQLGWLYGIEL